MCEREIKQTTYFHGRLSCFPATQHFEASKAFEIENSILTLPREARNADLVIMGKEGNLEIKLIPLPRKFQSFPQVNFS